MIFDWQSLEDRLYEQSKTIIQQFAAEHPDVICSFFAYETDPIEGYFMLGFDTYENALRMAQENEQRAIKQRNQMLTQDWSWSTAHFILQTPRLTDYSPDVSYFTYPTYVQLDFQELCDLFESDNYPQPPNSVEDNYIDGNVQIVLWKVVEQLIASEAFAPLHLSSPFYIGYQLHTGGLVILRILNWPNINQTSHCS